MAVALKKQKLPTNRKKLLDARVQLATTVEFVRNRNCTVVKGIS